MDISIFGAGSLGSLVGGLLAESHDVTLVGREPHVSAIEESGLSITGEFDRVVHPSATTNAPGRADLVVVTVKSFDTTTAARALIGTDMKGVLSLQNGMGNEDDLQRILDAPVLAGTCTYGARLVEPGVVECTGKGDVVLGPADGGRSDFADWVGEAFDDSGIETTVADDMPTRLWEKLAVNAGINAPTALARVPNGELVDGPGAETSAAAARETARVAQSAGVDLAESTAVERTREVADATAANTSSMQQDVLADKRTEIDAINGYVVDQATEPMPVNATLTGLIRAWEREQGHR